MRWLADCLVLCCVTILGGLVRLSAPLRSAICRAWALALLRSASRDHIPLRTQFDGRVHTAGRVNLRLGEHCRLGRDVFFETNDGGRIEIGKHVRINTGCMLVSRCRVSIGDHCLIGEYVSIRDSDHGIGAGELIRNQEHTSAPIVIGDNVWIARGAAILKGVTIGSGAVIGANSVVNKDVPAGMIAAGIPARVIRARGSSPLSVETV